MTVLPIELPSVRCSPLSFVMPFVFHPPYRTLVDALSVADAEAAQHRTKGQDPACPMYQSKPTGPAPGTLRAFGATGGTVTREYRRLPPSVTHGVRRLRPIRPDETQHPRVTTT